MAELGQIDTVYDRAALTALPEEIRKLYVSHLRLIVPETAKVFLLSYDWRSAPVLRWSHWTTDYCT
jgi:thiopurine S-methyltransferase